jgi:hypothetical protein
MADPKPKTPITNDDEETLVSPNGDTTADRYRKAKERDAQMSHAERIAKVREGMSVFDEMFPDFYDETEDE